ncbi:hypothetical protein J132_06672 [Termitomyces sp. J132]|nr:hypothetical protein H2248_005317 [Termitomyces sp. 'cryptogamus']KNZ80246.1 hypothetical protein J132_06672 [Termitomyces sp. J132]
MAQTLSFPVNDTSPTISYLPFTDTFPPNLTAGWNSFFDGSGFATSPQETGSGASSHITSHDQATLSITWRGTGIRVLGRVQGKASYNTTLDGKLMPQAPNPSLETLAAFPHLTDEAHNLLITAAIPPGDNQSTLSFDSAVIDFDTSSSSPLNLQPLNKSDILFSSNWGHQTIDNIQFHQSQTKDDVVKLTFSGAAFLLSGMTSPAAGKYSVVLDNSTSILTGQSIFNNTNTLLFYATGLDSTVPHHVQITNVDGSDLLLNQDGFQAFQITAGLPSAQSTSIPSSAAAIPKGTIAAVVLAGILGFLIISGFLYFIFVIRPQRRRETLARIARRRKKEKEAGPLGVLNIAPTVFPDDVEIGSQQGTLGHHKKQSSEKSGFSRWKREVEGGFGGLGLLGITFRHSGSTGRKSGSTGRKSRRSGASGGPLGSAKSSIFTLSSLFTLSSSKRSHRRGKKKAKSNQMSESSLSTGLALELPTRPHSPNSFKEKDAEVSRFSPDTYPSDSDMHTLSYMNTPPVRPAPVPTPAHSPSGSDSNSRSVLRSFSHVYGRKSSDGRILSNDDPKPSPHEDVDQSRSPAVVASTLLPSDPGHLSTLPPRDRGSARYSSDDATSYYLGSAATRLAIRNLSPRTTQSYTEQIERQARTSDKTPEPAQPASGVSPLPNSNTSFLYVATPVTRPIDISPAEIPPVEIPPVEISPTGISQLPRDVVLDIPPSSPFRIDFPTNSPRSSNHLEPPVATGIPEEAETEQRQNIRTLRSGFRLTPPSNPPSGRARNSFLDLEPSTDMSYRLQSTTPSEDLTRKQEIERPRWSNSTAQTAYLSRSGLSSAPATSPASGPISRFPYPVSLPPSSHHPEGHLSSRPVQSQPTVLQVERGQADRRLARLRLSAFGSLTDSVPMSVTSERRPRHSGSTGVSNGGANSSRLLPHPPLPDNSNPSLPPP